jgi:hypothetical protein
LPFRRWGDYALKAYRFLAAVNVLSKESPIDETKVFTLA